MEGSAGDSRPAMRGGQVGGVGHIRHCVSQSSSGIGSHAWGEVGVLLHIEFKAELAHQECHDAKLVQLCGNL